VPESHGRHSVPGPRAIAELPLDAALARTDELPRSWALALVRARPLEDLALLAWGELARLGPALCEQLIRAVRSDDELDRLRDGVGDPRGGQPPAARVRELAGARDTTETIEALELLRGALSDALLGELAHPTARQAAELSERVAHVCAAALGVALAAGPAPHLSTPASPVAAPAAATSGPPAAAAVQPLEPDAPPVGTGRALIVDELAGAGPPGPASDAGVAAEREAAPRASALPGIEIRDERREQGPAPWIAAIARRLESHERDGLPFAVLLAEFRDLERLRLETPPAELAGLSGALERVLSAELRGAEGGEHARSPGSLTRQRPGRCWLLVPESDRRSARARAERLARAIPSAVGYRTPPLEVLFGIAVCPEDGRQAATLAAHADIDLHAARSGRSS
jgi:hypothetical protein